MAHPSSMVSSQRNLKREHHDHNCKHGMTTGTVLDSYNGSDCNPQTEQKCPVYVHRFNPNLNVASQSYPQKQWKSGNEIHQNKYKHEHSCDAYTAKLRYCKNQFDSLTLNTEATPRRIPKTCSHKNSSPENRKLISSVKVNKSFLFKPEHKAVADKLEETYWLKWKPSKVAPMKLKTKGLSTENELFTVPCATDLAKKKERGDSNEAIVLETALVPTSELEKLQEVQSNKSEEDACKESDDEIHERGDLEETAMILLPSSKTESDVVVPFLKHTDSLILACKKKSLEKVNHKQPKCIKLFKNVGYTTTTTTTYIKGGSYPLKSCLKKETSCKTASTYPRTLTSARSTNCSRRPGKLTRLT